jgi:hypothetical protein
MQDVWFSSYKQKDQSWSPIIRTLRLQQRDHLFRYSVFLQLQTNVLQEDDILCELYADTRSDVSDYSDNESMVSDSDVPTSSWKQ